MNPPAPAPAECPGTHCSRCFGDHCPGCSREVAALREYYEACEAVQVIPQKRYTTEEAERIVKRFHDARAALAGKKEEKQDG